MSLEGLLRKVFRYRDIDHDGDLYLRRWYIGPEVAGWQLMLHKIARPDRERVLHDHPWDFATLCLLGGYVEMVDRPDGQIEEVLTPGHARLRSAEHIHRISHILGAAAWTLVLSGPRRRTWGFWDGPAFTPWRQYLNVPADFHPIEHAERDRLFANGSGP